MLIYPQTDTRKRICKRTPEITDVLYKGKQNNYIISFWLPFFIDFFLPPNIIGIIEIIMMGHINGAMRMRNLDEPGEIFEMNGIDSRTRIGNAQHKIM